MINDGSALTVIANRVKRSRTPLNVISTIAQRNGEISLFSARNDEIPRLHFVPLGMTFKTSISSVPFEAYHLTPIKADI